MYDVSTRSTPQNIRELFIHSSDVHVYNTRFSCADNLFVQKSRLHMKFKSFRALDTAAWLAQLVERQSAVWEVEGSSPRPDQHSGS